MVEATLRQWWLNLGILVLVVLATGCDVPAEQGPAPAQPGAIQPTVQVAPARTPDPHQSAPPLSARSPTMTPHGERTATTPGTSILTIHGRVVDTQGRPIEGAMPDLDPLATNGRPFEAVAVVSDEQGQYTWPVPPGRYRLTVIAVGYADVTQEVVVAAGQPLQITTILATK